jgi:hypothetical protein
LLQLNCQVNRYHIHSRRMPQHRWGEIQYSSDARCDHLFRNRLSGFSRDCQDSQLRARFFHDSGQVT